jgi:tricorn protease-like protein
MMIRIWDAETGHITIGPIEGHAGAIRSVSFSPDGKRVVSGSQDKTIRIWDAETGNAIIGPMECHTAVVFSVSFSPDGRRVASGSSDRTIRIWDAQTGQTITDPIEGHIDTVFSVSFSPDGKRVVSGSRDGMIRIWDAEMMTGRIKGLTVASESVWFSPHGKQVVPDFGNSTVHFQDAKISSSDLWCQRVNTGLGPIVFPNSSSDPSPACRPLPPQNGWIRCSNNENNGNDLLIFWVPPSCRYGLCDIGTLHIFGRRTTRVDFSRFQHGKYWSRCHSLPMNTTCR